MVASPSFVNTDTFLSCFFFNRNDDNCMMVTNNTVKQMFVISDISTQMSICERMEMILSS